MKHFIQEAPSLKNTWQSDLQLQKIISHFFSESRDYGVFDHLQALGELASGQMLAWAEDAEKNPPQHVPFDPWGKRVDELRTSSGWKSLEALAASQGIVATGYDRGAYAERARVYQMALLYLYSPSSAIYSCPLAMTDGAARAIELYGTEDLKKRVLPHLLSRDPQNFWTAGQWMTERTGGSDVSGTSTVAVPRHAESHFSASHSLVGTKWFTSATTSQIALTLARPEGALEGSKGLALFYLELRDKDQQLNNIEIHRLKDKLGTKALPTAELSLQGTPALMIGAVGEGVRRIASVLNITRIYNSICATGHFRRALDLMQDYSKKRQAFGKALIDHPLHNKTLGGLERDFTRCLAFCFFVSQLLGKEEMGTATTSEKSLLRILTPVLKLYTAKKTVQACSEIVEMFGGAGYVEDTGLPRLLRDAQVFSIWEGTTNVLSLDMLRAFEKEKGLTVLMEFLSKAPEAVLQYPDFEKSKTLLLAQLGSFKDATPEELEEAARDTAFLLGDALADYAKGLWGL